MILIKRVGIAQIPCYLNSQFGPFTFTEPLNDLSLVPWGGGGRAEAFSITSNLMQRLSLHDVMKPQILMKWI